MKRRGFRAGALVLACGLAGCATRADLLQQDRRLRALVQEQKKAVDQVRREVERLRRDVDEGGGRGGGRAGADRLADLDRRLAALEAGSTAGEGIGQTPLPGEPPPEAAGTPPAEQPPVETASKPATPPPAVQSPPAPDADEWRRDVAQEQAAAGTLNVPERAEYLGILDGLARKDCGKAVPELNSMAAKSKGSNLADNAIYWAGRCYALKGDQNQAISKFYDVVTRYPKSDKAPEALWQQGSLFLQMGDTPDARLALSKLIRDYPNSAEAAKARQKLSEIEQ